MPCLSLQLQCAGVPRLYITPLYIWLSFALQTSGAVLRTGFLHGMDGCIGVESWERMDPVALEPLHCHFAYCLC